VLAELWFRLCRVGVVHFIDHQLNADPNEGIDCKCLAWIALREPLQGLEVAAGMAQDCWKIPGDAQWPELEQLISDSPPVPWSRVPDFPFQHV
jgi:hypothetical protein